MRKNMERTLSSWEVNQAYSEGSLRTDGKHIWSDDACILADTSEMPDITTDVPRWVVAINRYSVTTRNQCYALSAYMRMSGYRHALVEVDYGRCDPYRLAQYADRLARVPATSDGRTSLAIIGTYS